MTCDTIELRIGDCEVGLDLSRLLDSGKADMQTDAETATRKKPAQMSDKTHDTRTIHGVTYRSNLQSSTVASPFACRVGVCREEADRRFPCRCAYSRAKPAAPRASFRRFIILDRRVRNLA